MAEYPSWRPSKRFSPSFGQTTGPGRRCATLAELERRGHRISLAGLNRILEHCLRRQLISNSPDGVRLDTPTG